MNVFIKVAVVGWDVGQRVECLPSIQEALIFIPGAINIGHGSTCL